MDQTVDGRRLKILPIVDEFTPECLAILVARSITAEEVVEVLEWLVAVRGAPEHLRSDNGPEFIAGAVRDRLAAAGVRTYRHNPCGLFDASTALWIMRNSPRFSMVRRPTSCAPCITGTVRH